jgi:hypothetical protein
VKTALAALRTPCIEETAPLEDDRRWCRLLSAGDPMMLALDAGLLEEVLAVRVFAGVEAVG